MARWMWNDHLDPEGLSEQFDRMLDLGLGGALVRPGPGLPPGAYLGEDWFSAISAVARRARRRRASLWIAEDLDDPATQSVVREILRETPAHAACMVKMEDLPPGAAAAPARGDNVIIAAFEVTQEKARADSPGGAREPAVLRPLGAGAAQQPLTSRRLEFRLTTIEDRLSLFHPEATLQLLERTHQRYHTQARKYFGNTIGLCLILGAGAPRLPGRAPWDPETPALFDEMHGYSLLENLPALFFDLPGCEAVRADFWGLVDEMQGEGFSQPFARWAKERAISHACAVPEAGNLRHAVSRGAHAMARYAEHPYAALAWTDTDFGTNENSENCAVAYVEARSIKRQLGTDGVVAIAAADARSAMGPFARGVNFLATRTVLGSLRGQRKHLTVSPLVLTEDDDPNARATFDAQARLAWMLGQGHAAAKVLLLHPHTSLQASYRADDPAGRSPLHEAIVRHFVSIMEALTLAHIDFDFADETVLAKNGMADQRIFRVGAGEYRIVVLPPLLNLRASTADLLHDFAMGGGLVMAVGSLPELVDGRRSDRVLNFFDEYGERIVQGVDFGRYRALVERLVRAGVDTRLEGAEGVLVERRAWDEVEIFALQNTGDRPAQCRLTCAAEVSGRAEVWDLETGATAVLGSATAGEALSHAFDLEARASTLVVVVPETSEAVGRPPMVEESRITPPWTARRTSPNAAVLCECRIEEAGASPEWTSPAEVRRNLAARLARSRGPVSLRTQWRFEVADGASAISGCFVVAELSEGTSLKLDGVDLSAGDGDSVLDPAMRLAALPALAAGEHVLELWTLYAKAGDLDPLWLRGPFAEIAAKNGHTQLAPARETIALGALLSQGLPTYFGDVIYTARVDGAPVTESRRIELRLPGLGEAAQLRVDGSDAGFVLPPHSSCDLSGVWRAGTRTLEVVLRIPPDALLAALGDNVNARLSARGLLTAPELVTLAPRNP